MLSISSQYYLRKQISQKEVKLHIQYFGVLSRLDFQKETHCGLCHFVL